MNFADVLNNYMYIVNCTGETLSKYSNLSNSTIARFRNGERVPKYNSDSLNKIISGLSKIAEENNISNINEEILSKEFKKTLQSMNISTVDFDVIRTNLSILIKGLEIKIPAMSKELDFDSSFIYRVCTGERTPQNEAEFIDKVCTYIVEHYSDIMSKKYIANFLDINFREIEDNDNYFNNLKKLLTFEELDIFKTSTYHFLENLNNFNLEDYLKSVHFDKVKIPTSLIDIRKNKSYSGLEEIKNAEIDFFKSTVISKKSKNVYMYSEVPMEEMASDLDFSKKWMYALAASIKKGLHLTVIHYLDRSFNELLLGLESWIPLYMTGQITPYYRELPANDYSQIFLRVSDIACVHGKVLENDINKSMYKLSTDKKEVAFYKEQFEKLIDLSEPLMEIYTEDNKDKFDEFMKSQKDNEITTIENDNLKKTFNNIDFKSCKNKWVMISKKSNPQINFVIHHKELCNSIEKFVAIVDENN